MQVKHRLTSSIAQFIVILSIAILGVIVTYLFVNPVTCEQYHPCWQVYPVAMVMYATAAVISITAGTRMLCAIHMERFSIKDPLKTFGTWMFLLYVAALLIAGVVIIH